MLTNDEMLKACGCLPTSPTALVVLAIGRAVERAAYEATIKAIEEFGKGVIYTAHDAGVRAAAKQAHVAVIRSLMQEQPT